MPMKLNVGLSKKIGLPNYGSLGATCAVELDLEGLVPQDDPEAFRRHVRNAYVACAQVVNEEITRQRAEGAPAAAKEPARSAPTDSDPAGSRGPSPDSNGNGSRPRPASEKQVEYIRQLARQVPGLGVRRLGTLSQQMYHKPLADLGSLDASGLIDTLKAIKTGEIQLDTVLEGSAT